MYNLLVVQMQQKNLHLCIHSNKKKLRCHSIHKTPSWNFFAFKKKTIVTGFVKRCTSQRGSRLFFKKSFFFADINIALGMSFPQSSFIFFLSTLTCFSVYLHLETGRLDSASEHCNRIFVRRFYETRSLNVSLSPPHHYCYRFMTFMFCAASSQPWNAQWLIQPNQTFVYANTLTF